MIKLIRTFALLLLAVPMSAMAEDGHQLWLRGELPAGITQRIDSTMAADDGYRITGRLIEARTEQGLLYGRYALMRGEQGESHPAFKYRILNHWDNLDGTIERGYAGRSIFWNRPSPLPLPTGRGVVTSTADILNEESIYSPPSQGGAGSGSWTQYAEACASVGINGTVLNNVNASPKMLTTVYLDSVKMIADVLRPWGVRVYLSVNFGSPKALGETKTADPLKPQVQRWWKAKAREIYKLIPDFGGFLVKANSEGQPGPFDYGRTHADGANMLADALRLACPKEEQKKGAGIVMWRSFVYGAKHKGEDRVKQAVSEFAELDGQFRDNVILQSKNGPLDFQPREPYAPIFDQMKRTPQMAELQITQEYLGQSTHLVYLAPMWKEFFSFLSNKSEVISNKYSKDGGQGVQNLVGIAGVANIGLDRNWCGHHFAQANWYAFGRLAWNPALTARQIAEEWIELTLLSNKSEVISDKYGNISSDNSNHTYNLKLITYNLLSMMLRSREACVDYMMPIGLHHIFKFDHHYGPEPDGFIARYPLEWCPVYYHKANGDSIGFDRTMATGSGATGQYREPYRSLYEDVNTCPENLLLWFHRVPWSRRLSSGRTVMEELDYRYRRGVGEVEDFIRIWQEARPAIDEQRWNEVDAKLHEQLRNAQEWQRVCTDYFRSFTQKP